MLDPNCERGVLGCNAGWELVMCGDGRSFRSATDEGLRYG